VTLARRQTLFKILLKSDKVKKNENKRIEDLGDRLKDLDGCPLNDFINDNA
tara:strand:- start:100 stop:252 length:153 start_codon:yes stop_codon:yes gene_type:complete